MTEYQQSVVQEFTECVAQCETLEELMRTGVHLFTISYMDTIIKACWPVFSKRLHEIAPQDRVGGLVIAVDLPAIFSASHSQVGDDAPQDVCDRLSAIIGTLSDQYEPKSRIHAILTADCPHLWRKVACKEFKAKRPSKPEGFVELYADTRARLEREGYRIELHKTMESDDILASIGFRCRLRRHSCILVTDDRDLLQCVGNGVTVYTPRSSVHKNEEWLLQEMQLTPKQIVDYLCLVGKDDVPSANKIGDINATKLLARCGSYPAILDSMDSLLKAKEVTAKQADSLIEFSTHYQLAKKMHTKLRHLEVNW